MGQSTLGVIYGNRNFFPDPLITEARQDVAKVLKQLDINEVALSETESKLGGVETHAEARRCADQGQGTLCPLIEKSEQSLPAQVISHPLRNEELGLPEWRQLGRGSLGRFGGGRACHDAPATDREEQATTTRPFVSPLQVP